MPSEKVDGNTDGRQQQGRSYGPRRPRHTGSAKPREELTGSIAAYRTCRSGGFRNARSISDRDCPRSAFRQKTLRIKRDCTILSDVPPTTSATKTARLFHTSLPISTNDTSRQHGRIGNETIRTDSLRCGILQEPTNNSEKNEPAENQIAAICRGTLITTTFAMSKPRPIRSGAPKQKGVRRKQSKHPAMLLQAKYRFRIPLPHPASRDSEIPHRSAPRTCSKTKSDQAFA